MNRNNIDDKIHIDKVIESMSDERKRSNYLIYTYLVNGRLKFWMQNQKDNYINSSVETESLVAAEEFKKSLNEMIVENDGLYKLTFNQKQTLSIFRKAKNMYSLRDIVYSPSLGLKKLMNFGLTITKRINQSKASFSMIKGEFDLLMKLELKVKAIHFMKMKEICIQIFNDEHIY